MEYKVSPFGSIWSGGVFTVPTLLTDKYLKMASEYQLKALLFILRQNGRASTQDIAKAVGTSEKNIDEMLEFWTSEGLIELDGKESKTNGGLAGVGSKKDTAKSDSANDNESGKKSSRTLASISPPRLSPKDIVALMRSDNDIKFLLTEAQRVLGRSISHAEQEMLINMVTFYGLKAEIVLMILEFYRSEKNKGRSIGLSYIGTMAKNWADEGIDTVAAAEEKLKDIEKSDRLWNEVVAVTGIKHRRPTDRQRETVKTWFEDFDITMISLAADIMKENISEPKLSYMNSILKKWKADGVKTPEDVKEREKKFEENKKKKASSSPDRLKGKATYDLEKIKQDAMNNTEL